MSKKYTKAELEAMLNAAGLNLPQVQERATATLSEIIDTSADSIEENRRIVAEAQAEISRATVDLKQAQSTLSLVSSLGS